MGEQRPGADLELTSRTGGLRSQPRAEDRRRMGPVVWAPQFQACGASPPTCSERSTSLLNMDKIEYASQINAYQSAQNKHRPSLFAMIENDFQDW